MTPDLPSLDAPAPGTCCGTCGYELRLAGFCPECFERAMRAREAMVAGDLARARKLARTWQLSRGVRA